MKRILLFLLLLTFGFIHAEEWIYYCSNYKLARISPDGLENEILIESNFPLGYHLTDISLDKTKLLYIRGTAGPTEEAVIFDVESMDMQETYLNPELPPPWPEFYFPEGASFTDDENEIIFIEDQYLYKYSFLDSSVTLLIENENGWGEVGHNNIKNISQSPDKTKIAYMEADSDSSHLIVFDIQNNETSVLGTFSTPYDGCSQKQVYWSTGDYILFSICDMNDLSNLFKIHSSNGESAQLIENEIFNIMETRESPLEKLVYTKNSQCPTCYRIIDLESNEISDPDNNMQYEYNGSSLNWYSQAWSPDHSKVVMAGVYADSSYYPYLPYSSFLYIYNISTDSFTATTGTNYFIPVFWVGESDVSVVEYMEGWNLIGLPLEVEDASYNILFPESLEGTLYSFNGGYITESYLTSGEGYWLRFANAGSTTINGSLINDLTISLIEDWNLVSGLSEDVSIYSVIDPDSIIVPGTLYGFNGGYIETDMLVPGKGYWLRAYQYGDITLSSGALTKVKPYNFSLTGKANSLSINNTELYFGIELSDRERLSYSLPPKPPSGAFDVRFKGDTRIAGENTEIEVMNPSKTLAISYDIIIDAGEHMSWILVSESGNEFTLEGTGEITVPTEEIFTLERKAIIPIAYTLHQNYPNPFNPITSLRYDLPVQAQVTLTVYDMLGREVTQLVNTVQEAGYRSVQWDATNSFGKPVSAGVYLYQIRAGEFVQTKKMVLLN